MDNDSGALDEAIIVTISTGGEDEADRIVRRLLQDRLAACVKKHAGIESTYWWQEKIETATEVVVVAKTLRILWPELLQAVREEHSYEVFEAIATPIALCNPDYLSWIRRSTLGARDA